MIKYYAGKRGYTYYAHISVIKNTIHCLFRITKKTIEYLSVFSGWLPVSFKMKQPVIIKFTLFDPRVQIF